MIEHQTASEFSASKYQDGQRSDVKDMLAEEVPVALEYNGLSHAVMLATPADLEDFALGFSLTEGIIAHPSEWYGSDIWQMQDGIRIAIDIASERFQGLKERRRNLTGRTGCGLCGTESLEYAVRQPHAVQSTASFTVPELHAGFEQMMALQALKQLTGATHAAAWMDKDGTVALLREDVGRHNALDKLIGILTTRKTDFSSGAALVTSRASYEMAQKCASVGIGMLAAVSAPTALAARFAEKSNLTLIGFARSQGMTIYTKPDRVL